MPEQNDNQVVQVFLHVPGRAEPEVVSVSADVMVRELLVGFDGHRLWVEEADVPLDVEVTFLLAGIGAGSHLHRGPCGEVAVTVSADGREAAGRFPPATRAKTVIDWAAARLGLAGDGEFELVNRHDSLAVTGPTHLGSVNGADGCAVSFDLQRVVTDVTIFVNTTPQLVPRGDITFEKVVKLAYPTPPPGQAIEYEVSYRDGPPENPKGTLLEHHDVRVREGMSFTVSATDRS